MAVFRKNLGNLIDHSLPLDVPALVDLRDPATLITLTHAQVDRRSGGVARLLLDRGLTRRDRVAIAALNRSEYLIAYFGIMRAGLVAVPINIKLGDDTLEYVLKDAEIKLAFVDSERKDRLEPFVPVIDFDDSTQAGFHQAVTPQEFTDIDPGPNEVAQMLYTSGSTGLPKGVPLSHAGQIWSLEATYVEPDRTTQPRYLLAQPLFHMNGLFMAKRAFASNSALYILPSFEVTSYVAALEDHRISIVTAVPTMFARIVKDPELVRARNFSSLKRVMLGSAPMTLALYQRIQAAFPSTQITHGYGTTEAGPAIFGPHPKGIPTPPLALGYPIAQGEVKLVGGQVDDEGVLWMRNPAVLQGYHRLPVKSAQVLHDGWYDSGDVMRRDDNGFYYFVGRADDMYPVEVEKVLESHPEVRQSCVVPIQDEERGNIPVAFVVKKPASTLTPDDLKRHYLTKGPAYQHPRRIQFLDDLPWAGTNKVDRAALLTLARKLEAQSSWGTDVLGRAA